MAEVLDSLLADWSGKFNKTDDYLGNLLSEPGPVGIGDIVKYDHLRSRWLVWNGVRWRPDMTERVNDMARIRAGLWMASTGLTGDDKKALLPIFDVGKKVAVLKSMRSREGIAQSGDQWDNDGFLVGFDNGILDLKRRTFMVPEVEDGRWQSKIDPSLLVSKSVGYDFDPTAECPRFDAFLLDIMSGNVEMVKYIWRVIGYSLIGTQVEQKFWMWVGRGSNGKGVLARTLMHVFGEYAFKPADSLYMRTRYGTARSDAARPDLMDLHAKRFTYMSEPPGGQFNEEMLKAHTGEDIITARALFSNHEAQFTPTHKINFLTNDPPKTDDVGVSMRRRVRLIRFEEDYSANPDTALEDGLKAEAAGIMTRAFTEALAWQDEGMTEPDLVTQWSREYIEENDPLGPFVNERCELGPQVVGPASALWAAYEDWAAVRGSDMMSQTGFGNALSRRFKKARRGPTGSAHYLGVRAKSAVELADA